VAAGCWPLTNCACNALNALVNRHAVVQQPAAFLPVPPQLIRDIAIAYRSCLAQHYDTWLARWPLAKRALIAKSLLIDHPAPGRVKPFVKREVSHKPPTKARLIQGYPNLATQVVVAREMYAFQKALAILDDYEVYPGIRISMGSGRSATWLSGWPTRSMWDRSVFYERDGKNWDATMSMSHHQAKIELMRACSSRMVNFVNLCRIVKGTVHPDRRGGLSFRYRLDGTVKSGHNDTTSGNSIINLLVAASAARSLGLSCRILATGDDLIMEVRRDPGLVLATLCARLMSAERAYGIVPEARLFSSIHDVTFVSGRWLAHGAEYRFVPLAGRLLARLWWTVKRQRPKDLAPTNMGSRGRYPPFVGRPCCIMASWRG